MKSKVGPKFLCIGAQKSGTTWLRQNLAMHPKLWMPPVKELHYHTRDGNLLRRRRRSRRSYRYYGRICKFLLSRDWDRVIWMIKYAFAIKANDNWYLTLMGCKRGCFTGDITPAYATLDRNRIVEIKELLPDIKIIFIMRNPVDRVWSAVRMEYKRGKIKSISDDEFTREPKSNEYMKRTQYTKTIDDWVSVYGEENVFLCFYEEIIEHPMKLLENITSFLRIGFDEEYFQASAKKRANRGKARELPTRYGNILATMFQDEITELASRYGEYPERWLSDNKKYL